MSNRMILKLDSQYNHIHEIVRAAAEGNAINTAQLLEDVNALGNSLKDLFILSTEKTYRLRKKLVELRVPAQEIEKLLSDDLSILEEMVSFDDLAGYAKICKTEYAKHWERMEDKTKKFLITSYYLLNAVLSIDIDCSPVVVELAKSIEEEMSAKLYYGFIFECSRQPTQKTNSFDNELEKAVFNYRKDITAYYVPLSTMFDALMPSQRLKNNIYYQMLQQKLIDEKWDTSKLCSQQFVDRGKDYAKNCRNAAAHSAALTSEKAKECTEKTKEILSEFLSACNL